MTRPSKGSVAVFSNLGTGGAYDCCSGYTVNGPEAGLGEQWIAAAFTPDSDRILTEIAVAATYNGGGKDRMILSLYSDDGGVPGAVLGSWRLQRLESFHSCCVLGIKRGPHRLSMSVKGGTQYWVVLSNDAKNKNLDGIWNWNTTDTTNADPAVESWCSSSDGGFCSFDNVWTPLSGTMPAFAVYGK
ncbi:MAG TPA: choice-of-anchor R domain-containing protein [Rhizomicrobium sp.]|nr:choice-of-anchor R domain-containing protein [Rhizomicrobium sp.]